MFKFLGISKTCYIIQILDSTIYWPTKKKLKKWLEQIKKCTGELKIELRKYGMIITKVK